MFLPFFLCQVLSASDEQRPEPNLTVQQRIKIHKDALNCLDDKDSLLNYFRYKWTDVLTRGKGFLWGSEKLPSVEFQDFIDTAIKSVCQNEDLKHHTDRLSTFLKDPSLFKDSVQMARDQIRSEKIALQKTRMKRFANWLGSYVPRNRFSNIYMKKTNVNEQAAEDLRLLVLIIQLEHVISTDGLDEEKDDNKELYLFKIRQMLHNPIRATAPWLEKWQAHIEHNHPYIKKMSDWSGIKERIQDPYVDFVRAYYHTMYDFAVILGTTFCLALCSYQIYHYGFYTFWTNLLGIFGTVYTTKTQNADSTSFPLIKTAVETFSSTSVPALQRRFQTLDVPEQVLLQFANEVQSNRTFVQHLQRLWRVHHDDNDPKCFPEEHTALALFGDFLKVHGEQLGKNAIVCLGECLNGYLMGLQCYNPNTLAPNERPYASNMTVNGQTCYTHPARHEPGHLSLYSNADGSYGISYHPLLQTMTQLLDTITKTLPQFVTPSHTLPVAIPGAPQIPVGNCTYLANYYLNNPFAGNIVESFTGKAMKNLLCNITRLSFRNPAFGLAEVQALLPALPQYGQLLTLDFNGAVLIGNPEVTLLASVIARLSLLTQLEFANTALGDTGAKALAPVLLQLSDIYRLNFRATKITDIGALDLLPALKQLSKLGILILSQLNPKLNTTTQAAFNAAFPGFVDMS